MDSLRKHIRKTLEEAHYTTWKSIDEVGPLQYGEGVRDLYHVQDAIAQKLAKHFNIKKIAPLGSGSQGYAYYIPNNRVLKVTTDKSEVAEAFKIKGKKLKHLANIYEAFTLGGQYEGTYVIISELLNKVEEIDNADQLLADYLDSEFGYSISFFFEDYSNGSITKDEIKEYKAGIKEFYKQEPKSAEEAIWYMVEKFGVIDDIRRNGIKSTDWGLTNLGLKKDGKLAMYDLGYGDPNIPDAVHNINLNHEGYQMSIPSPTNHEYPDFFDGQNNPTFHAKAYPPVRNMNDKPLAEGNIKPDVIEHLLRKLKAWDTKYMASGMMGDAYEWGDKVIKFTRDTQEARLSQKFVGKKFNHIADVYKVMRYEDDPGYWIYIIIMEKLLSFNPKERQIYTVYENTYEAYERYVGEYPGDEMTFEEMINDLHAPHFEEFIDKHEITQIEYLKKEILDLNIQIENTKKEVESVMPKSGGKYRETAYGNLADMHAGNIGKKANGNFAFFDMRWKGYSDRPEKMKTIKETEISNEEINKKELPYKFFELFDDFVREKTEAEIREIAPTLDLNQRPDLLMMSLETNYPALFDNFSDWLFNKEKEETTIGSGNV